MKIGFVSLPLFGHLNPMTALARKLQSRGNDVVFIGLLDAGPIARAAKLKFIPFCENEYPLNSLSNSEWTRLAALKGKDVIKYSTQQLMPGLTKAALEHLPKKIAETGVEALAGC